MKMKHRLVEEKMKPFPLIFLLVLPAILLAGCSGGLPFDFELSPGETQPVIATPVPVSTITPAASFTPSLTPSNTPTFTPFPTQRSPYPAHPGTPVPDAGFPRISSGNLQSLQTVFQHISDLRRTAVNSPGEDKALVGMSSGLWLYSIQDGLIASWPEIRMADVECDSCLTVDENIRRFAVVVRAQEGWEISVYELDEAGTQPILVKTFSDDSVPSLQPNPAQVAFSPDGELLAYRFGDKPLRIYNFFQDDYIFEYSGATRSLTFSRGGQYLLARRMNDIIFWNIYDLNDGFRSMPFFDANAAITFSRGGDYFAVASGARIRIYGILPLRLITEINVPPAERRQVTWEILPEEDESFLRGEALYRESPDQPAMLIQGRWDIGSGDELFLEVREAQRESIFDEFWGLDIPEASLIPGFDPSDVRSMRFTGIDTLLLNGSNAICSFRLTTGETGCRVVENGLVHALDGPIYREEREERRTLLFGPLGETVFELGPHPIRWVSRAGDYVLIDNRRSTTDLYFKGRSLPSQSVSGVFQSVSENNTHIVFLTRQANGLMYLTLVEKATQQVVFQRRETRLFDFIEITLDGTVYYLRDDYDGQATLRAIPAGADEPLDVLQVDISAPITSLSISPQNVMAVGMQDGLVLIIALDSLTYEAFQALQTGVTDLAFSPDGRYLATLGREGILVFAVLP
jgi:WD40 repeat protein